MAIYHFSAKVIGRSAGRSAIASAAYRAAERLHDDKLDREHDFTAKAGVVHSEILLPEGAPARWGDRGTLWNEVEAGEKRKDAQLARDIEISLPRELGKADAIALARDFVLEQFVSRGMVADLNVHWGIGADGEAQPHAHVMLSMREVVLGPEGDGAFGKKAVAWNDIGLLRDWRERWAGLANERLAELGHDLRIDHRSYREQGIDLEPQHKIGPAGARRAERGEDAERRAEHDAIARRNGERIMAEPSLALDALTRQQATFGTHDLARLVSRHTDGAEQFRDVLAVVQASPELVRLGQDGRGRERFTTQAMLHTEQRMEGMAAELAGRAEHRVRLVSGQRALLTAARGGLVLGDEQRDAFRHVTGGADLALVVGYAGTGKSAMLGVARQAWEAEGLVVRGAALSGIAAEGLEGGSGIASRTLASLEWAWAQGHDRLGAKDVLVVDEAGLVGSRQMERVLSVAREAGAKVVLVGDPEQLQAIEAGAAFRALAERHGAAEISAVRRQHVGWQRDATRELATERTTAALGRYAQAGMVQEAATHDAAKVALVAGWDAVRRDSPEASQVMLAYTRADAAALNALAREHMRAGGALGTEQAVQTERGVRAFAAGDRLMFLRNERGLGVKNGTLGTVEQIEGGTVFREANSRSFPESQASDSARLVVRLDSGQRVSFGLGDYAHVEHGYAATIHKAQGVTVDRAHVLASTHMDRHAAYVALTRHRDAVALHYGRDEFADASQLARVLGRERLKDTSLDYGPGLEGPGGEGARDALARRYAERRGLDPLHPHSEIVVRAPEQAQQPTQPPTVRRNRFAGLKLGASPERATERAVAVVPEPVQQDTRAERLARGLEGFARAWSDAARMEQAGLPVLPHQEVARARAHAALEREGVNLARDTEAVLAHSSRLAMAASAGEKDGVAELGRAVGVARRERLALEERARGVVRAWGELEGAFQTAERGYDWDGKRVAAQRLEAFAKALKQDRPLDRVLRERGQMLGVPAGSRLEQVVQARDVKAARRVLRPELGLSRSRGLSLGM